jgi:hypothetical protein
MRNACVKPVQSLLALRVASGGRLYTFSVRGAARYSHQLVQLLVVRVLARFPSTQLYPMKKLPFHPLSQSFTHLPHHLLLPRQKI